MNDELIRAYESTDFIVFDTEGFVLRIGERNEAVISLMKRTKVDLAAYISAQNPFSRQLTSEENARRHQELLESLKKSNYAFVEGEGRSPVTNENIVWREASVLVMGVSSEEARSIGRKWEQNAIVLILGDGVPILDILV